MSVKSHKLLVAYTIEYVLLRNYDTGQVNSLLMLRTKLKFLGLMSIDKGYLLFSFKVHKSFVSPKFLPIYTNTTVHT